MTNRKPISKTMRFEVFKRDGFACQYCGRRPPDVTLVCDHIKPVADGGQNDFDNLITSCQDCNAGKGKRLMGNAAIRPDAEAMLIEARQEIGELLAYQEAAGYREEKRQEVIESLQTLWRETTGLDWHPADHICRQMMAKYDPWILEEAFVDVAAKVGGGYLKDKGNAWLRYLWVVARNLNAAQEEVA